MRTNDTQEGDKDEQAAWAARSKRSLLRWFEDDERETGMSDYERVATAPREGDEIVLRGGLVKYVVSWANEHCLNVFRDEVFRAEPYVRREGTQPLVIGIQAWGDLVRHGASSVKTRPYEGADADL